MNKIETFLADMTKKTDYRILEESKDKTKLKDISEKYGIDFPSRDLAIFEGRYAFVDKENKNGCTLPKEEVKKSLSSLRGKAIDFDHFRNRIVGHWLGGELDNDEIVSYGAFFKSNLEEDYDLIKELMDKKVLAISFEAWGDRDYKSNGSYDLNDIVFAGGALLIETEPAFPGTEVLEMSKQKKVLEFAKVMTRPKEFIHSKDMTKSNYNLWESEIISRYLYEAKCPICNEKGGYDVKMIDFEKNKANVECIYCNSKIAVDLDPSTVVIKKGRKKTEKSNKKEECKLKDLLKKYEQSEEMDVVEFAKLLDTKLTEALASIETLNTEKASVAVELKVASEKLETIGKAAEEAGVKVEDLKSEITARVEKAASDAKIIAERKAELGESAKDMSDEDLLNSDKFDKAKLEKEKAEIQTKLDEATELLKKDPTKASLVTGSSDKTIVSDVDKSAARVRDYAYPNDKKSTDDE